MMSSNKLVKMTTVMVFVGLLAVAFHQWRRANEPVVSREFLILYKIAVDDLVKATKLYNQDSDLAKVEYHLGQVKLCLLEMDPQNSTEQADKQELLEGFQQLQTKVDRLKSFRSELSQFAAELDSQ